MGISSDKKPVSFSFNNTERCQSHCVTCNGWKTPSEYAEKEMTTAEWKAVLLNMHRWLGNYQFIISGGEPFIREDIFEVTKYASDLGDTVNVITNGLAIPNLIDELLNSAFTNIIFSLNAVKNPSIHNESRGREDAFKKTMDSIQNLNYRNKHEENHKWKNISSQKKFAQDACENDFVLSLDADEVLSPELVKEINNINPHKTN